MRRIFFDISRQGIKDKAVAMGNKYFESFPHMNFAYDSGIMPFINVLISAKDFESAKKHLRILAEETKQYIAFYESQTDKDVFDSFRQDYEYRLGAIQDILDNAKKVDDPAFEKEMSDMLNPLLKTAPAN